MDSIGPLQTITTAQTLPITSGTAVQAPVLPTTAPDTSTQDAQSVAIDTHAAEQKRLATIQQAAQDIANVYVVGDKKFSIYKDTTGQYITRFTSLRDGKVTYIPEPTLVSATPPSSGISLNIKA